MTLFHLFRPEVSWAYIDPNSGGYLFSLLASGLYMIWIFFMYFFGRYFVGKKTRGSPSKIKHLSAVQQDTEIVVPYFIVLSYSRWKKQKSRCLEEVLNAFTGKKVIVRSASEIEDHWNQSNAGKFQSYVIPEPLTDNSINELIASVETVFKKDAQMIDSCLFIQEYETNLQQCGVLFTEHPKFGKYLTLSYVNEPGDSDLVTGSRSEREETILCHIGHLRLLPLADQRLVNALLSLKKYLPKYFGYDFEYGIRGEKIYVFQARALTFSSASSYIPDSVSSNFLNFQMKNLDLELRRNRILSNMADWNPVEILGVRPSVLANSIFEKYISRSNWIKSRKEMGYYSPEQDNLCYEVSGSLYVRIPLSLSSLTPASASSDFRKKLIECYLEFFQLNIVTHDQVEFQFPCSLFRAQKMKMLEALVKMGLEREETDEYLDCLIRLTERQVLDSGDFSWEKFIAIKDLDYECLDRNLDLVSLQFCKVARHAFIARKWIEEFVHEERDQILEAISKKARFSFHQILKKQGVTTFRQREYGFEIFSQSNEISIDNSYSEELENGPFEILGKIVKEVEPSQEIQNKLTNFVIESLVGREVGKRILLLSLQRLFDFTIENSDKIKAPRACLEFLKIDELYKDFSSFDHQGAVLERKFHREIEKTIFLPDVILKSEDLLCHRLDSSRQGYYIGENVISGKITSLDDARNEIGSESIVLLERGEPGLDWLFNTSIAGIITKYGGPNSHVAIQCFEKGKFCILGVGQKKFDDLQKHKGGQITIDFNRRNFTIS